MSKVSDRDLVRDFIHGSVAEHYGMAKRSSRRRLDETVMSSAIAGDYYYEELDAIADRFEEFQLGIDPAALEGHSTPEEWAAQVTVAKDDLTYKMESALKDILKDIEAKLHDGAYSLER